MTSLKKKIMNRKMKNQFCLFSGFYLRLRRIVDVELWFTNQFQLVTVGFMQQVSVKWSESGRVVTHLGAGLFPFVTSQRVVCTGKNSALTEALVERERTFQGSRAAPLALTASQPSMSAETTFQRPVFFHSATSLHRWNEAVSSCLDFVTADVMDV